MRKIINIILILFFLVFLVIVYREWFSLGLLSAGDHSFFWPDNLTELTWLPEAWDTVGLGRFANVQYFFYYSQLPLKVMPPLTSNWAYLQRVIWFFPFIVLTIFSARYLLKKLEFNSWVVWAGVFVYFFNTFILMIVSGGQASIFLAYSIFPLVIGLALDSYQKQRFKRLLLFGLVFSLLFCFEPRFAILCFFLSLFLVLSIYGLKIKKLLSYAIIIPLLVGVNFFWLLPAGIFRNQVFGENLTNSGWLDFLSLASFSNAISFLQPNWPENIFGKVYLMRPEFILGFIFILSPMLFFYRASYQNIFNKRQRLIYLLSLILIIIGAFLAKGVNPPLGFVYRLAFEFLPVFNTFRDPVKFYFIIAIGYLLAVPCVLVYWESVFTNKPSLKKYFIALVLIFIAYWGFLLRPALFGPLPGLFQAREIPNEYYQLANYLKQQDSFFRTLWVPTRQRYGYQTKIHPAVNSDYYISPGVCNEPFCQLQTNLDSSWLSICNETNRCYVKDLSYLKNERTPQLLRDLSVKYIIIPADPQSEIFISERSYSSEQRDNLIAFCDSIEWLVRLDQFKQLAVYEISGYKDLFYDTEGQDIDWKTIGPSKFVLKAQFEKPTRIVFSQQYSKYWQLSAGGKVIPNLEYSDTLSSFEIDETGGFEGELRFLPQKYIEIGAVISSVFILACLILLII